MAKLQLNPRNFSSENHRITLEKQTLTLAAYYSTKQISGWVTQEVFLQHYNKENYLESLEKLLNQVEVYSGLTLIKSPLKIVTNDREHQAAV